MVDFLTSSEFLFSTDEISENKTQLDDFSDILSPWDTEIRYKVWDRQLVSYNPYPLLVNNGSGIWNLRSHSSLPASVTILKDVCVREYDFCVKSLSRNKLLKNSIGSHRSVGDQLAEQIYAEFTQEKSFDIKLDATPVLICNDGRRNYWHWHAQTMLTVMFIQDLGLKGKVLFVSGVLNNWQRQCLEALGVSKNELIELPGGYHNFETLVYPSFLDPRSFISMDPYFIDLFNFIKRKAKFVKSGDFFSQTPDRIYVSRRDAPHRTMDNESQLIDLLKKFDFVEVVPSQLSYQQQISIFSKAKVVVGIHGAGLTNIGFLPKNSLCIEIFHTKYMNYVYYVLSRMSGINYECILTSSPDYNSPWTPDLQFIVQQILRSIAQLHMI